MTQRYLIANTTRVQRLEIVRRALGLGESDAGFSCDGAPGEDNAMDMYLPYIDGEMEIDRINAGRHIAVMQDMMAAERGSCPDAEE